MTAALEISEDLSRRIDLLTQRTTMTRSQIVENALAQGRSLARQEQWIAGVEAGLADAEHDRFATDDEIAAVLERYRPA